MLYAELFRGLFSDHSDMSRVKPLHNVKESDAVESCDVDSVIGIVLSSDDQNSVAVRW